MASTSIFLIAIVSPFFAIPEMGPSDFRSKKLATLFAYGGPRSSCVRPVSVLRCATHSDRGYHTDSTPCRMPPILSLPALTPQTPTKQAALRLRGGRRTPLVRYRSLASVSSFDALQSASGRRSRATLRRPARPSSFWGARRTRSLAHRSLSSGKEYTEGEGALADEWCTTTPA
jgi:hypothetical protein